MNPGNLLVILSYSLYLTFKTSIAYQPNLESQKARCFVKMSRQKIEDSSKCKISYDMEECEEQTQLDFPQEKKVKLHPIQRSKRSFVNIFLSAFASGSVILIIKGSTYRGGGVRCLHIQFYDVIVHPEEGITLHTEHLHLPDGVYNLSVFHARKEFGFEQSPSLERQIVFRKFKVGFQQHPPDDFKGLNHHHRLIRSSGEKSCPCCIEASYNYVNKTRVLQFTYSFPQGPCNENFEITLFQNNNKAFNNQEEKCISLNVNSGLDMISKLQAARGDGNVTGKATVNFENISTGCYVVRAIKFHGFYWLQSMYADSWNTEIRIIPSKHKNSIYVDWIKPEYPYTYSSWELDLLKLKNQTAKCYDNENVYQPDKVIKAFTQDSTNYTFMNLEKGFYCVHIKPVNCSEAVCTRSSITIELRDAALKPLPEPESSIVWVVGLVVLVGLIIAAVVVGTVLVLVRKHFRPNHREKSYDLVPQDNFPFETMPVLLIWTRCFVEKRREFEEVIKAFKKLLTSYSKCEVYDYLDYASLNNKEKQELNKDPVQWLQTHMQNSNEKIIFVECPATHSRPQNGAVSNGSVLEEASQGLDDIDARLFPFACRYLRDSVEVASDYSKIFYVRFSGLDTCNNDVADLVTWVRYTLPNHLRKLTLKLRGFDEEVCKTFPNPPDSLMNQFQARIEECRKEENGQFSHGIQ